MTSIISRIRKRISDPSQVIEAHHQAYPGKIYPPATPGDIATAEEKIGFHLPELLKEIYQIIGNGGFGPGYGLIGIGDGYRDDILRTVP